LGHAAWLKGDAMFPVQTGLDRLRLEDHPELRGRRLALLANPASLDGAYRSARDILTDLFPGQLRALFGPQHGYGGQHQDNMVETPHSRDAQLGVPVFSLYSHVREPEAEMFAGVDILIIDLQDVGCRVYTFATTVLNCLKAAARCAVKVLVLDRPNPVGGEIVEGNLLDPQMRSFVGPHVLPMRHGLTLGELALMFNRELHLGCELRILRMQGWQRSMPWVATGLRWHMPSPNMPCVSTARVYPGQVLWEGTNLSEGRGTCRPFEIFGAPFLDTEAIKGVLEPAGLEGCHLQPYVFEPTFHKWQGQLCHGFLLHVTDPEAYRPYYTALALLKAMREVHGDRFRWRPPPYEYEYDRQPIDLLIGDTAIRQGLEGARPFDEILARCRQDAEAFQQRREPYLLYA